VAEVLMVRPLPLWKRGHKVLPSLQKIFKFFVMINHVVLFKLKKYDSESEKQDVISSIEDALLSLSGKIEELKYIEVGVNYELTTKSYDICLISHFETVEQLDAYRIHPEHVKVAALVGQHAIERAAVDYEF
jgi:hypothetical protein